MKKILLLAIVVLQCCHSWGEDENDRYKSTLRILQSLIEADSPRSFKLAVFAVESIYLRKQIAYDDLNRAYALLSDLVVSWSKNNSIEHYDYPDSNQMILNRAVFQAIKDTIKVQTAEKTITFLPFNYNFDDYDGKKNWVNTFVSTLLSTHKGNCHSLPYLYKILADEVGARCWLALAPNHMYIKNYSKRDGWYNTELTSGEFPIDAWLTTTSYITLTAIQNGLYCDTLSNQQSIALCAIDLAKAYEKETNNYYDGFILQCCDLVLKYHAVNPQALLLKAETLKRIFQLQDKEGSSEAKNTYHEMERLYVRLYDLGYREMPDKMYKEWLQSLKSQKDKYGNKKVSR